MAFPDIFPFFAKAGGYEYVLIAPYHDTYVSSSSASWMFDTQLLICRIIYDFKYVVHILQVRTSIEMETIPSHFLKYMGKKWHYKNDMWQKVIAMQRLVTVDNIRGLIFGNKD